ncbi:MAG: dTDP-4-dehydrorhamnose 3,5-epimerase [Chloroflexi bacterium]|jgi:dTDP-4-dehydrorhamnose 3,5-epimerase|nr:MAG: dTDP-4-dehydrorhamnose 3,5-epimerase [Chloroflexota bacterium]
MDSEKSHNQIELTISKTKLPGVLLIKPATVFEDFRGSYIELYNEEIYKSTGILVDFKQDDISTSKKNVLRGIHGDSKTWKLVSCLFGRFYLVVVDCKKDSKQFRQWESFELSDVNREQVLIPPGFGNGHLVLSERAIFHYKQSTYYDRESQFTYLWNDPELNISWPINNPILSIRDSGGE